MDNSRVVVPNGKRKQVVIGKWNILLENEIIGNYLFNNYLDHYFYEVTVIASWNSTAFSKPCPVREVIFIFFKI